MARLPKNPEEAVEQLGVTEDCTVICVGPEEGYAEALAELVGTSGRVVVHQPPPDLTQRKKAIEILDELPADAKGDPVLAWFPPVQLTDLRDVAEHVAPDGALWLVLQKGGRDFRATVTEGETKRAMLTLGWRETKVVQLSTDDQAVRFHRRR